MYTKSSVVIIEPNYSTVMIIHSFALGPTQWRIKGGGALWASARGPALSGGPTDFLGLAVVYGAMFFGTAPHGFGRTLYMYRGAGAPRFNIKYESRTFLCN